MKTNRFTLMHEAGSTKTTKEFNAFTTDVIFDNFADFLRGCGFMIEGTIDVCTDVNVKVPTGVEADIVMDWTTEQLLKEKYNQPILNENSSNPNIITGQ